MARRIEKSINFSSKDNFNIVGAATLESVKGSVIDVIGCAIGCDVSHETGEEISTGYLKDIDGNIYSTVSNTAMQSIDALIDIITSEPDKSVEIQVNSQKSKSGRDFIVLTMV